MASHYSGQPEATWTSASRLALAALVLQPPWEIIGSSKPLSERCCRTHAGVGLDGSKHAVIWDSVSRSNKQVR